MLYSKKEILQALKNQIIEENIIGENIIEEIVIDSRKARKNTLFICIEGENNDGHNFILQAQENGCDLILVHKKELLQKYQNLILVKNTFDALYEIAKYSRSQTKAKIIAITGSAGKTSTKELLKTAFQSQGKTNATIGNLNNHFGLPLTLCNLEKEAEFAILEMGMNHLNEISPLSKLAKPHICIITNVGSAHIENFKNEEEIALAKSEIFHGIKENGFAIINRDNSHFEFLKNQAAKFTKNIITFGKNQKSDYILQEIITKSINSSFAKVKTQKKEIELEISLSNQVLIFNSLTAIICLDLIGKNFEKGIQSLKNLETQNGRGKIFETEINNKKITIIDDSYNANLSSVKAGIDFLQDLKMIQNKTRSIAILGDIFELGHKSSEIHQEVLNYAKEKSVDFIICVGQNMKNASEIIKQNFLIFQDSKSAAFAIKNLIKDGDILLIKGSRAMKMEEIIPLQLIK